MLTKDRSLEPEDVMEFFEDIYIELDKSEKLCYSQKDYFKKKIESVIEIIRKLKMIKY